MTKQMRMAGEYDTYIREEACIQILVGKPERRRPLGRPRCKREGGNTKIVLQKVGHSE